MSTPDSTPYTTLLTFSRCVGLDGLAKSAFISHARRQRGRRGFNPHAKFVAAAKADLSFGVASQHLTSVTATVDERWRRLYQQAGDGWRRYLSTLDDRDECAVERVHHALDRRSGLTIKINPHFGIRRADGGVDVVRFWFDEAEPREETVLATLHLMGEHAADMHPDGRPVLLDLRRGVAHREADRKPAELDRWLAGEAALFAASWQLVA